MVKRRTFEFVERATGAPFSSVLERAPAGVPFDLPELAPAFEAAAGGLRLARQSPAMHPRDEMIFLLHTAAEIEHSLMIQYLYAAYSLPKTFPQITWRLTLLGIAREEMGHLMSAQNLLLALGAPLNFDREDYPFNKLYPFPLELRPVSVQSLARYVLAEMPDLAAVPPGLGFDLAEVRQDAGAASGINRVGALFELMIELTAELGAPDIVAISPGYQAEPSEWRAAINNLVLAKVGSVPDMASLLVQIGEQGEGSGLPAVPDNSHFVRLFKIYKAAKTHVAAGGTLALDVPHNPSVLDPKAPGYIAHPEAGAWADVFNHRYRWLLAIIEHFLRSDATAVRQQLVLWAFEEMTVALPRISAHLTTLPLRDAQALQAAPPFELPYTLALPARAADLWRHQQLMATHAVEQLAAIAGDSALKTQISAISEPRLEVIRNHTSNMMT